MKDIFPKNGPILNLKIIFKSARFADDENTLIIHSRAILTKYINHICQNISLPNESNLDQNSFFNRSIVSKPSTIVPDALLVTTQTVYTREFRSLGLGFDDEHDEEDDEEAKAVK